MRCLLIRSTFTCLFRRIILPRGMGAEIPRVPLPWGRGLPLRRGRGKEGSLFPGGERGISPLPLGKRISLGEWGLRSPDPFSPMEEDFLLEEEEEEISPS